MSKQGKIQMHTSVSQGVKGELEHTHTALATTVQVLDCIGGFPAHCLSACSCKLVEQLLSCVDVNPLTRE